MPKSLLLIRHAKSSWDNLLLQDFKRPLNERGKKNAPEMAQRLLKRQLIPQQLVCSPALRALTTAEIFATEFKISSKRIIKEPRIYEANTKTLLEVINGFSDESDFTAVFGHNPGLSDLAHYLCDEAHFSLPTCGIILLKFPFDKWQMLSKGTGELFFFDYPKNIFN